MNLLDAVRREARRRGTKSRRGPAAPYAADEWKQTEQALAAEMRASPAKARALVDAFGRLARSDGSSEARGRAARLRASLQTYLGRDREAVAAYRDAIRLLDGPARDGAKLGLAASLTRLGRFADARRLCSAVRVAAEKRGDAVFAASADVNEGVARHESGDFDGAATCYARARAAFTSAGRAVPAAFAADNLANALVALDRFDEAEAAYADAERELAANGAAHEAARSRMNRASLLVATDRLGDADAALRACEDAFRASGDPLHAALSRRDRGEALLRAGLVPEARHALRTAERALRAGPVLERDRTTALLALAALAGGDAPAARRIAARIRDRAVRAEVEGRADAVRGRHRDAARRLARAARSYGSLRPVGAARCAAAEAWCHAASGDASRGVRLAREAETRAAKLGVPSVRFAASATRFVCERAAGRRSDAETALDRAADALESVRAGLGPETMRAALLRGREDWLAGAVRFLLDGDDGPRRALAFLERWRARSLVDLLGAAGDAPPHDDARIAAIRRVVAGLERRAEGPAPAGFLRAPFAAAPSLERRLREAEAELLAAMTSARGGLAAAPSPRDLDRVRAAVPADAVVLALFADDEGGVAFALGRDGVECVRGLAPRHDTAHAVRDLHFALGSATFGPDYARRHAARLRRAVDTALARLAAGVLDPVADRIASARRVFVLPHGPWHHVPFAALPWRGAPLVASAPVTVLPALAALRSPPPAAAGRPVVVSVPDEAAPETRVEADRVAARLGALRLEGDAATAATLAALDRPSCLHVAAHGRHRPDAPAASGVRLADGWFRAAEFARLRLAGSLVVLSGCETGLSTVDAGDEVHGLVRGVLASGASDVVSSLWRVDDVATARFMERFHEVRAAGEAPGDALAAAQRESAAAGAHPWLWAGFTHHSRRLATAARPD